MIIIPKVALFDMDGTVCDYVVAILRELAKLRSPEEPFIDPFLIGDSPHGEYQYLWDRMDLIKADENWWANLPRLSLGFDVMEMARDLGYVCEILTQSPRKNPAALAGKLKWILANLEDDIEFTMTRNKSRHYGRVLVDDYPGFAIPWLKHRPRGIVIMPQNKYNLAFTDPRVIKYTGENKDEIKECLIEKLKD